MLTNCESKLIKAACLVSLTKSNDDASRFLPWDESVSTHPNRYREVWLTHQSYGLFFDGIISVSTVRKAIDWVDVHINQIYRTVSFFQHTLASIEQAHQLLSSPTVSWWFGQRSDKLGIITIAKYLSEPQLLACTRLYGGEPVSKKECQSVLRKIGVIPDMRVINQYRTQFAAV
jgi:hypothetical protein